MRVSSMRVFILIMLFPLKSMAQNKCLAENWILPSYAPKERAFILGGTSGVNDLALSYRYKGITDFFLYLMFCNLN